MRLTYVLGYPGSGKTTALTGALERLELPPVPVQDPVPHVRYGDIIMLGQHRFPFGGTDTLSMSIQPKVIAWLTGNGDDSHVVGEGDRLANAKFFDALRAAGVEVQLLYLDVPPQVAVQRARDRAHEHGKPAQSIQWIKGRITKVDGLVGRYRAEYIDGTAPAEDVAEAVWAAALAGTPA